jgi:four helix bundle protein
MDAVVDCGLCVTQQVRCRRVSNRSERKGRNQLQDFRNLKVWSKAHQLTIDIYKLTAAFPKDELFGLRSQMRRCSTSIGSNIAEGCGRNGDAELNRFVLIAMGSASELEYQLLLSRDLGYLHAEQHSKMEGSTREVKRMLASLAQSLKAPRSSKQLKRMD